MGTGFRCVAAAGISADTCRENGGQARNTSAGVHNGASHSLTLVMHVYECASIPYMCAELLISVLAWNTQHYAERWTRAHGASKSCSGADPQIPQRCRELDHFCCDRGEGASSQHPCNFLGPISVVGYMLNSTTVQHPRLGIDASRWAACDRGIVRGACQHRPWCRTAHGIAEHMGILCH